MSERTFLRALADRVGILPEYLNYNATEHRQTTDETRVALLDAMGFDAGDEASAEKTLACAERQEREKLVDPVRVTPMHPDRPMTIAVRVPIACEGAVEWFVELREEDGSTHASEGRSTRDGDADTLELPLPVRPGWGYHRVRVTLRRPGRDVTGEQCLIVTPESCLTIEERVGDRRLFGLWTNLYTIRSRRNWGIGDFGDLSDLVFWAGKVGAAFVGLNPLHTLRNRGIDISPYRPVSRLYRNMLYLDIHAIPELTDCPDVRRQLATPEFTRVLNDLRSSTHVEYERIDRLKRTLLEPLHRTFQRVHRDRDTERGRAFARYAREEGDALVDFATFTALADHLRANGASASDWRDWPTEYRNPRSDAVATFRRDHAREVDFRCYLQFELDRQLAKVAGHARRLAMPIGLYNDLAIGTAPDGCDPWSFPGLFVDGASVGAPPDDLGPTGQDWGLPPVNPLRLREDEYRYWIRLLRSAFAHAGALRIDHVMGLLRQFWIPRGRLGTDGAYVRYPADDLFAILALESRRCGALMVGEDLGTVPAGFAEMLEQWGILSTRVLYFEREWAGEFRPSTEYSNRAVVSVNSHDLVPLAGFAEGRDLTLRFEAGSMAGPEKLQDARSRRREEYEALCRRLQAEGLEAPSTAADHAVLSRSVHEFVARTPAPLAAVSLDDLAGETDPVNLPGVGPDRFRSWRRRMISSLEELTTEAGVNLVLDGVRKQRAGGMSPSR